MSWIEKGPPTRPEPEYPPPGQKPKYSALIQAEKDNPQYVFNKTHKCPRCGHCTYEGWRKVKEGEFIDDGR